MEQEMSPLAQIRYRITLEQYLDFNRSVAEQNFKKQRRKSVLMGGVEMVVGALFLVSLLALEPQKQQQMPYFSLYLVLGFILILLGVYSVVFYKVIFPRQLVKSATKQYQKSEYLRGEIFVAFYEDHLFEESGTYSDSVNWDKTEGFRETPTMLQVMLSGTRCILIPKKQIAGQVNDLRELFLSVAQKYDLNYQKASV